MANRFIGYLTHQRCAIVQMPTDRGRWSAVRGLPISRQSLPTDPIGTTTVTFSGVNAGSEIRVYLPDGTELTGIEYCAANQQLAWSVYAPGANSTIYITILLRGYRWMRFNYTPVVGNQTLPIFQIADLGYSNPA
jgi:hypothetical protein